jgi:hypothetical protein
MDSSEDLLTFITSSVGGRNAIAKLLGKVAHSVHATEGKMPVCELERGSYDHDDFGVVNYPVFKVVDWAYWDGERGPVAKAPLNEVLSDSIPF